METIDQTAQQSIRGGEFLLKNITAQDIFTPEDFSEDQRMIATMVKDFIEQRVAPNFDRLEKLDIELTTKLLKELGDLGVLGIPFPDIYGGSQMDFVTNILLSELMGAARSLALSFGAHTSIGMLPILYFGTEDQKQKYLPALVAGDKFAAYCLTEPGSGSDALAAKSSAVLADDGTHYLLSGQKMWITNAGFADVFTVFAKVDGKHFTGFIVEKDWEGVSLGAEEDKLGIKGSSTRQVFFEQVKVPTENVLGEIGKGHKIAFNILNVGRIKLGSGAIGGSKVISNHAIRYANERKQFGQAISNFGAIQHKLAEQAIKIYVNESAVYRAANDIGQLEHSLLASGKSLGEALLGGAEEYAIECALMKVHSSECLDFAADEGLQIFGGMGYSEEAPMAATYRDARINRIFEGTNEINRMLSVDMILKRTMNGTLDLVNAAKAVQKELLSMPSFESASTNFFAREKGMLQNLKKAFLLLAGATAQALLQKLSTEQEILMHLSDMMGDIYLAESAILRTEKMTLRTSTEATALQQDMTRVFLEDAVERFSFAGKRVITAWATGEMKRNLLMGLRRFTKYDGSNTVAARRNIAQALIDANEYCF
ncbi:MAG: acyl-CoA dehydrogenase family protein [Saprospiraceae bacterium]